MTLQKTTMTLRKMALVAAAFLGTTQVGAQQVTGMLGSPSATTTLGGVSFRRPIRNSKE